jgi:hypothetical protein
MMIQNFDLTIWEDGIVSEIVKWQEDRLGKLREAQLRYVTFETPITHPCGEFKYAVVYVNLSSHVSQPENT